MIRKYISHNIGLSIGFVITLLLFLYQIITYPLKDLDNYYRIIPEGKMVFLSLVLGGIISGFFIDHFIIRRSDHRAFWGTISGSILLSPLSFFLSLFFNYFGMLFGIIISLGLPFPNGAAEVINYVFSIISRALGIIIFEYLGALLGFVLGSLIQRLFQRSR